MIFPIYEVNKNELTSLKGEVSLFYQIITPDLSQFTEKEVSLFYSKLHGQLKNLNENCFYKIYYINDRLYLNTNDYEVDKMADSLVPCENPLAIWLGNVDLFSDIELFDDYFIMGNDYCRLLNFYELPTNIYPRFLEQFGDFVIHLRKMDSNKAKSKLDRKRKMHFSLALELLRNIESEKAHSQSENLLENVMNGDEAIFDFEGWFLIKSQTKKELDQLSTKLMRQAKLVDFELLKEVRGLSFIFNEAVPGVKPHFKRSHVTPHSFVTGLLPMPMESLMNKGFLLNAPSGRSVRFALFNKQSTNFNLLVAGASGQGKSMIANKVLKEELLLNSKAIVLDLGNSFKRTVSYYNGENFSKSFNPLEFQNPSYLKAFVLSVVGEGFFSKLEEGKLFNLLKEKENNSYSHFDDFLKLLETEFMGISFFFSEVKDYFSNEKSKVGQLTYCDLSLYPDAIKAPLIIYLIERFKRLEGKKIFIFDEVWSLLTNNAEYLSECFRTFRKHFASAVAIAQNLEDFLSFELGRVIYQNSCHKFLFRQDVETPLLDNHAKELLNQVSSEKGTYGEFLVLSDLIKKIVRYYPDQFEFEQFNTDDWQLSKFQKFYEERKEIMDFQEIFDRYVYLKYGELI